VTTDTDSGIDLSASLHLAIGNLAEETKKMREAVNRARALVPADVRLNVSATSPSSGDFWMSFGGPAAGFYWVVRRLIVGGASWSSTVSGSAELYVTAGSVGAMGTSGTGGYASIRDLNDLVDQAANLPTKGYYGFHELVVGPHESLAVVIDSPSASTLYKATIGIQLYRVQAEEAVYLT
jgi:hypothetical protein